MATPNVVVRAATLDEHGKATSQFREEYQSLTGHTSKRMKITKVIRCGQIIEAAGLTNLLSILDNEEFFAADENSRKEMVKNVLSLNNVGHVVSAPVTLKETEKRDVPPAEKKAEAETPVKHSTVTPPIKTTRKIENEDGSTTIFEKVSPKKGTAPAALAALNIPMQTKS
ncbi:hypothetical protein [Xenorhabdus sp. PB30.3]|uniref:hypothetical protein n=1 Tax=Xenorhabdus sp. PB30.3 TaxID=2788941 RepID=UPI001E43469D|nr:hypothetical protein [Xenorhabdus sp. PB30.3]MCC8379112.1 hypothetical protein [Xenorhabdus sp. PB30.3]